MKLKEKETEQFQKMAIGKGMSNEEILGIMLRDDQFLNMMSDKPNEDIKKIWQDLCPRHNQVKSL